MSAMSALFEEEDLVDVTEAERELPELVGSERQLPWARAVRARKLRECDQLLREWALLIERHEANGRTEQAGREREDRRVALDHLAALERRTAAGWWLNRRDNSARELLSGAPAKPGDSYAAR